MHTSIHVSTHRIPSVASHSLQSQHLTIQQSDFHEVHIQVRVQVQIQMNLNI